LFCPDSFKACSLQWVKDLRGSLLNVEVQGYVFSLHELDRSKQQMLLEAVKILRFFFSEIPIVLSSSWICPFFHDGIYRRRVVKKKKTDLSAMTMEYSFLVVPHSSYHRFCYLPMLSIKIGRKILFKYVKVVYEDFVIGYWDNSYTYMFDIDHGYVEAMTGDGDQLMFLVGSHFVLDMQATAIDPCYSVRRCASCLNHIAVPFFYSSDVSDRDNPVCLLCRSRRCLRFFFPLKLVSSYPLDDDPHLSFFEVKSVIKTIFFSDTSYRIMGEYHCLFCERYLPTEAFSVMHQFFSSRKCRVCVILEEKLLYYRSLKLGPLQDGPFLRDLHEIIDPQTAELNSLVRARVLSKSSRVYVTKDFPLFREDLRIIANRLRCDNCLCLLSFAGHLYCYECRLNGVANKKKRKFSLLVETDSDTFNSLLGSSIVQDDSPQVSIFRRKLTSDGDVELNPGPCRNCGVSFFDNPSIVNGLCHFCYASLKDRTDENKDKHAFVIVYLIEILYHEKRRLGRPLTELETLFHYGRAASLYDSSI